MYKKTQICHTRWVQRAGSRPRPLRPLPRASLLEKGLKFRDNFFFLIFLGDIKKEISLHFFSLLRRSRELSNARDRNKTNLNK